MKGECEDKYGPVTAIKVIKDSQVRVSHPSFCVVSHPSLQGEIYVQFETVDDAAKALAGLGGRWFGGRLVSASYVSDVIMQASL